MRNASLQFMLIRYILGSEILKRLRPVCIICCCFIFHLTGISQQVTTRADTLTRRWLVAGATSIGYGGTLVMLDRTWYSREDRSSFHTFNDSREWLQVDKFGHAWTAYVSAKANSEMWDWAGVPHKKAVLLGSATSLAFLTGVEVLDGFSRKWGWSWSDIGANFFGIGLFTAQELGWGEQRIQYKFSFHRRSYREAMLNDRADDLYGAGFNERMLKDYNAQTYWFSFNINSFTRTTTLPPWLNIAVGYGATGMYGGFENKWTDKNGVSINRTDIPRTREFYLSPDIDFTKIPTRSKLLRTTFTLLNAFKFPAPALLINNRGKLRGYLVYF